MRTLARWSFDHRRLVLLAWLLALVGLTVVGRGVGSAYEDTFELKGTDSAAAYSLLSKVAPSSAADAERIVIGVAAGKVTDPAVQARITPMLAEVAALPHVARVVSPYSADGAAQVSADGRVAFASVQYDGLGGGVTQHDAQTFLDTALAAGGDGLQVAVGGQVAQTASHPGVSGAAIGVAAAAIVLLLVFGSLLAAVLPLITALVSLGIGMALVGLLSNVLPVATFSTELSTLIGLGVGVDYALFIVTRYRQGLRRGDAPREAAITALDTSGRAVLFAGITVGIALLGLFALGVSFLYGVALAAALTVALTVAASLTLLPALLGFFGVHVLSRRQRRRMAQGVGGDGADGQHGSRAWTSWAQQVQRRPAALAAAAAIVLIALSIPFFSMRLGTSDQGNDPTGSTTRQAYDLLADGFGPGFNGPLQLIAPINGPADRKAFSAALAATARTSGVAATTPATFIPAREGNPGVAVATVFQTGSPQSAETTALIQTLRTEVVPKALKGTEATVYVGGLTAIFEDFAGVLGKKLPLFVGVVVALSFLLLVMVFRSLLIPATAAVMNLLSAAAAFGAVVAVFQWGYGVSMLGVGTGGPIETFVPVMMFAILFGLSMDYQVFLLSRIYEEWHHTRDNKLAVTRGLATTGHTITAAASIMVLVFGAFILGDVRTIKLFGFGLAVAVLLDALIVRSVLVPAIMHLLGDRNWALPTSLDRRLPRLNIEGAAEIAPAPAQEPVPVLSGAR